MERHIVDIAIDLDCPDSHIFLDKLDNEDIKTAKQIVDILAETKLPIHMVADILDFCKYAIQFGRIEPLFTSEESSCAD